LACIANRRFAVSETGFRATNLQHGSLIISRDPDFLFSLFNYPSEKIRQRQMKSFIDTTDSLNMFECFASKTATFMIMGDICTRNCKFCAVKTGKPQPLDPDEPYHLAQAAKELALSYIVITSVTRDDLPDGGASHFASTIEAVHKLLPEAGIEVLVPDFKGSVESIKKVIQAKPNVFNHNVETVPLLKAIGEPTENSNNTSRFIGLFFAIFRTPLNKDLVISESENRSRNCPQATKYIIS